MVQNWGKGVQVEWGSGLILGSSDTSCIKLTASSVVRLASFCDSLRGSESSWFPSWSFLGRAGAVTRSGSDLTWEVLRRAG